MTLDLGFVRSSSKRAYVSGPECWEWNWVRDEHDFGTAAWGCGGRFHDRSQAQRVYGCSLKLNTGADSSDRSLVRRFRVAGEYCDYVCLTVSQMAYLLLLWLSMRHEEALAD